MISERTCIACRKKRPRADLLRFVRQGDIVHFDPSKRMPGRGAWTCSAKECVETAIAKKSFARALRTKVSDDDMNELCRNVEIVLATQNKANE